MALPDGRWLVASTVGELAAAGLLATSGWLMPPVGPGIISLLLVAAVACMVVADLVKVPVFRACELRRGRTGSWKSLRGARSGSDLPAVSGRVLPRRRRSGAAQRADGLARDGRRSGGGLVRGPAGQVKPVSRTPVRLAPHDFRKTPPRQFGLSDERVAGMRNGTPISAMAGPRPTRFGARSARS